MESQPVRILQIGMTKNIGGIETYLMQQFEHLDRSKLIYDFVNITSEYEIVFKEKILKYGGKIYGIRSRHSNPIRHYWQWIKLLNKIAKNYKAIVLNSNSIIYVFPIFIARFFGIPMRIMHAHNAGFEQKNGFFKELIIFINRILLKWGATDYFACSKKAGHWMFGPHAHFTVIPNAIDCNKFKFNEDMREKMRSTLNIQECFVVGHVGRFAFQKNHEFLIDIFNEIHTIKNNAVLLLIGDAVGNLTYLNNIKEKIDEFGLTKSVIFMGMRDDVPQLMQAMDCFVFPSHFEGLCIAGIEAQASGLPCFFSDTISEEIKITSDVHFISLRESADYWARIILLNKVKDRSKRNEEVKKSWFDINNCILKIQNIFIND